MFFNQLRGLCMIKFTCEIQGKKINPNNFGNSLESMVFKELKKSITKSIGGVTCPEHNKPPSVAAKGKDVTSLTFEISGCCDKLIQHATNRLESEFD